MNRAWASLVALSTLFPFSKLHAQSPGDLNRLSAAVAESLHYPAVRANLRNNDELTVTVASKIPQDEPPGNQLRVARQLGSFIRDRLGGSAALKLINVVFRSPNPPGTTLVVSFRLSQLTPGDTASVMMFTSDQRR